MRATEAPAGAPPQRQLLFNAVAAVGHTTAGGGFPANLNKVLALGVRCARRFQP